MKSNEVKLFTKYLKKSKKLIEFGSGGSTIYAFNKGIKNIFSVETDESWINKLKENPIILNKLKTKELILKYFDLKCTWWKEVSWSKKKSDCDKTDWGNYYKLSYQCNFKPDLILIDGRFRVASALGCIKLMDNNTFLLFHDYTNRLQYHIVEEFFDKIETELTLQVFKKKEDIDFNRLEEVIKEYELIID